MSKRFNTINGNDFAYMIFAGAENLRRNVDRVNGLNVFPVPDGDTGTNMSLTLTSGVEELKRKPSLHIGKAAEVLSKGLLMGARGNSGVILSQLFRGFSKHVHELEEIDVHVFAAALQQGVETAYKAVVKPVEGTILTVSKEAAKHAVLYRRATDMLDLMQQVVLRAGEALARTPDQLPILKQVGVVDAGGQGLVCIYEGFITALQAGTSRVTAEPYASTAASPVPTMNITREAHQMMGYRPAQSHMATEDIEFGYCTEFMLTVVPGKVKGFSFTEPSFRDQLSKLGDSLLVVSDEELVKVHIHAEYPGEVMNLAMKYGDLSRIKIDNMRDQHSHIVEGAEESQGSTLHTSAEAADQTHAKPYGFVAVAMGQGMTEILTSVGVDVVLSGGQTMNPSTEDLVKGVNRIHAKTVYILPNNSNIILAAEQARDLVAGKTIVVIPTKSIPQGLAAILAFQEQADTDENTAEMTAAIKRVKSGQVTYAVRDTNMDGMEIKMGHFIGIEDGKIVSSEPGVMNTSKKLLQEMIEEGSEIVTILSGEDAKEDDVEELEAFIREMYPEVEIEHHPGGQPLYPYIFSVE